jgi:alpha-L-arabinofuranosidase
VTLTNAHATEAVEVELALLGGAQVMGATGRLLSSEIHAHNTFDAPAAIEPAAWDPDLAGATSTVVLPAASVVALEMRLA